MIKNDDKILDLVRWESLSSGDLDVPATTRIPLGDGRYLGLIEWRTIVTGKDVTVEIKAELLKGTNEVQRTED